MVGGCCEDITSGDDEKLEHSRGGGVMNSRQYLEAARGHLEAALASADYVNRRHHIAHAQRLFVKAVQSRDVEDLDFRDECIALFEAIEVAEFVLDSAPVRSSCPVAEPTYRRMHHIVAPGVERLERQQTRGRLDSGWLL